MYLEIKNKKGDTFFLKAILKCFWIPETCFIHMRANAFQARSPV